MVEDNGIIYKSKEGNHTLHSGWDGGFEGVLWVERERYLSINVDF